MKRSMNYEYIILTNSSKGFTKGTMYKRFSKRKEKFFSDLLK